MVMSNFYVDKNGTFLNIEWQVSDERAKRHRCRRSAWIVLPSYHLTYDFDSALATSAAPLYAGAELE